MAAKPDRVYYARPQYLIGTASDKRNIRALERLFPGAEIDAATKKECKLKKGQKDAMAPFFERVDNSGVVVVVESKRGHVSAGVCAESLHAQHDGKPVMLLKGGTLTSVKSIDVIDNPVRSGKWAKLTTHQSKK